MTTPSFIIIDDDATNNLICKITINRALQQSHIVAFTDPEDGFEYFRSGQVLQSEGPVTLLLDINMPKMTGWEFLEQFDQLPDEIKNAVRIYIVSSSIAQLDQDRAQANKYVQQYLCKPLGIDTIRSLATAV